MKKWLALPLFVLFCFIFSVPSYAKVTIKLGTFVPDGSFWVDDLKAMGAEWRKISEKDVRLKIYPGGIQGDEATMVRKLNIGQLSSATLSVLGLAEIVPEILAFSTPLLFKSDEEVDYVMERIRPLLQKKFEDKGYEVIQWGSLGWIFLFSKTQIQSPEELIKEKLYVGTPEGSEIYQEAGFQVVTLDNTDVLLGLQNGLITAYNFTPLASMAYQWFAFAPNMMDLKWAPALVGTIVKKKTWNKIKREHRDKMKDLALSVAEKGLEKVKSFDLKAREVMVKNGLQIHKVDETQQQEWVKQFSKTYSHMKKQAGKEFFNRVVELLTEYRKTKQ